MLIMASYVRARIFPMPEEKTFEEWVCNRFGRRLFEIFFKTYTEKVWGMKCSEIGADWASQRIKNLNSRGGAERYGWWPQGRHHHAHQAVSLSPPRARHDVGEGYGNPQCARRPD